MKCGQCGSNQLVEGIDQGEIVCLDCGDRARCRFAQDRTAPAARRPWLDRFVDWMIGHKP